MLGRGGSSATAKPKPFSVCRVAGDGDVDGPKGDLAGDRGDRGHGSGAHPVDRIPGGGLRETREKRGHPAKRQALVTDLGRGRDGDLFDALGRKLGVATQEFADAFDDEVVGASLGIDALGARLAERRPDAVNKDDFTRCAWHSSLP